MARAIVIALVRTTAVVGSVAVSAAAATVATRWAALEDLVLFADIGDEILTKLLGFLYHDRIGATRDVSLTMDNS